MGAAGNNYKLLNWMGSTIDLVELSYALVKAGCFGNATLKDVIETFQFTFQKKLGNYTKKYQEMLSRKKGTTSSLPDSPVTSKNGLMKVSDNPE